MGEAEASATHPDLAWLEARIGPAAAAFHQSYLDHGGATRAEVERCLAAHGGLPFEEGLRAAEQWLGPALLREAVSRLGFERFCHGLAALPRVGLSTDGSFPFLLSPAEARLLVSAVPAQVLWRRMLLVAHGSEPDTGAPVATSDEAVQRFRAYNLVHAALLEEILAVAPVDREKADRILGLVDRVVVDFAFLFEQVSDEARQVAGTWQRLRSQMQADLAREPVRGPISGEAVRRLQAFEDPRHLDDVTTVHGLKRYLHQQGLQLAFRIFRPELGANRSVDLLVASEREILVSERPIRYLQLEACDPVGPARLPFAVSLLAEALGRQLLLGRKLPSVTVMGYGNEFQIYVRYRNHPAFLRLDLSPPLRGGMLDLEYYAVSQYEMAQHPDLSLQGMQRVLRTLELDVSKDGFRLKARYDKERASDMGDILAKVRALFELLPYLMDVDWVIGDLDYPVGVRAEVAAAWAGFFGRWAVLPWPEVLASGRRKVVLGVEADAAGPREVTWDGRGHYRDRLGDAPAGRFGEALGAELERRGLAAMTAGVAAPRAPWGQALLDEAVLRPLAEAVARGEAQEAPGGFEPVPADRFQREHEAVRLAEILDEGGPALEQAVRLAGLVRAVERQVRFRTSGSVQGYAVQSAALPVAPRPVGLFVLRDAQGIVRLALAAAGGVLYRRRRAPEEAWSRPDDLAADDLIRRLRGFNYLVSGPDPACSPEDVEALRGAFREPSPRPVPRLATGERIIPATVASPGRATGFACFLTAGLRPEELEGAVLVARTIRPEDAPWLRRAAGVLSTGGGILSHAGLIALELQKPAVIVAGRWSGGAGTREVLLYRRPVWREEELTRGRYRVVCRLEPREVEEAMEPGDLLVVDAERGSLGVLGRDAHAVALHQDLRLLEVASAALAVTASDAEVLASRGRLLRAAHQLERLVARLADPALARHAARELLARPRAPEAPEGRRQRARLLSLLLQSPTCGAEARGTATALLHELRARLSASTSAALAEVPRLATPAEVLFSRLGVLRLGETFADARELLAEPSPGPEPADGERLEEVCRQRLEELCAAMASRAGAAAREPAQAWRLRHLVPRLQQVMATLGRPASAGPWLPPAAEGPAPALQPLVLEEGAGGIELAARVGAKAAGLGEITRVLGRGATPRWFAVTDAAFRRALEQPLPEAVRAALELGPCELGAAIAAIAGRTRWSARRQADGIREAWLAAPLPEEVAREVTAAYAALAGPGQEPEVAVRSSGREEDTELSSWAGQFDTFLCVRGAASVLEHLKLAWAGFWTERAVEQRRLIGEAPLGGGGGVVVQRMVDSRVSGVLHTVCAATGQLREMVINAGLGLGEGVVSGAVEVDTVLVSKDGDLFSDEVRLRYRVGDKRERVVRDPDRPASTRRQETLYHQRFRPALEYVEICELVRAAARLEEAFLEPLDIEFAIEGRDLRILQVRPVPVFAAAWRDSSAHHPLCPAPPGRRRES
ncbi:MAG: hypothetical protein HZB56_06085 [Deltaproteobacteria bacterium]|nr:hypothetical protein [Deltaproteobacteria bacterium]